DDPHNNGRNAGTWKSQRIRCEARILKWRFTFQRGSLGTWTVGTVGCAEIRKRTDIALGLILTRAIRSKKNGIWPGSSRWQDKAAPNSMVFHRVFTALTRSEQKRPLRHLMILQIFSKVAGERSGTCPDPPCVCGHMRQCTMKPLKSTGEGVTTNVWSSPKISLRRFNLIKALVFITPTTAIL